MRPQTLAGPSYPTFPVLPDGEGCNPPYQLQKSSRFLQILLVDIERRSWTLRGAIPPKKFHQILKTHRISNPFALLCSLKDAFSYKSC